MEQAVHREEKENPWLRRDPVSNSDLRGGYGHRDRLIVLLQNLIINTPIIHLLLIFNVMIFYAMDCLF